MNILIIPPSFSQQYELHLPIYAKSITTRARILIIFPCFTKIIFYINHITAKINV